MSKLAIALLWLVSLGAAVWVGTVLDAGAPAQAPVEPFRGEAASAPSPAPAPVLASRAEAPAPAPVPERAPAPRPGATAAMLTEEEIASFSLEGVATAEEANRKLMALAATLLAQGPEGHLRLLQVLNDEIVSNQDLERLFGDDEEAARHLYPWIRFLVEREGQVVDMTETLYRAMAENPAAFESFDDDTLEIFTEGVSYVLPGAVSEERLERFRGLARAILERPEGSLPGPVEQNRRRIARALGVWAPPMTPEQALEALRGGQVRGAEALRLLSRVPPDQLSGVDVVAILGPLLREGEWRAFEAVAGHVDPRQVADLDDAMLDGMATGRVHPWAVRQYLQATNRLAWPAPRSFAEAALGRGGQTAATMASAFLLIEPRPDADWLRWAISAHELPEQVRQQVAALIGG
jgi:hypothetical protein